MNGNVSRRVVYADQIKKNLFYSDEGRGNFNSFLQKLAKVFLVFKDEGGPMAEEAKIRALFEEINHPELKEDIVALEVQHDMSQISYIQITNHLIAKVSKFETASASKFKRNIFSTKSTTTPQKGKAPTMVGCTYQMVVYSMDCIPIVGNFLRIKGTKFKPLARRKSLATKIIIKYQRLIPSLKG